MMRPELKMVGKCGKWNKKKNNEEIECESGYEKTSQLNIKPIIMWISFTCLMDSKCENIFNILKAFDQLADTLRSQEHHTKHTV